MEIKGIKNFIPISVSDWDGKVCSVIFLGGCNFRCPYCFNYELINPDSQKDIHLSIIMDRLKQEKPFLDGVCITGGEPTLNPCLVQLCIALKDIGLGVKLDTNGSNPDVLKELIEKKLVDYIAMDIKAAREKYEIGAGVKINLKEIEKSVELIKNAGIDYEFRTTIIPKIVSKEDILSICNWLRGSKKYVLQQVDLSKEILKKGWKPKPYKQEEIKEILDIIRPYFHNYKTRNIYS